MPSDQGGLGAALVGDKIMINSRQIAVTKLLGEGGFSYVYLVKEMSDTSQGDSLSNTVHGETVQRSSSGSNGASANADKARRQGSMGKENEKKEMVLKVTSILSRQQRDIAEKEAKLLSRLSHPSIVKMYDTCYRTVTASSSSSAFRRGEDSGKQKERSQHLILMELCEGGHALEVCNKLAQAGERFDLSTLIIAFGQICNAVSYLHAQRPPIVHRDLKPANFLIKNGAYKLCDFGSAVFGPVDLKTPTARADAEEVIQKTTTQMFRAPEMVDLYMCKKLTQATDVWALGACLYSLAYLQNCFEEGSNLAILSRKYKIPDDNAYGDGLVELIDRMLTVDSKARADMTEVILCLSAVYSGRPLPPRKERKESKNKKEKEGKDGGGGSGSGGGGGSGSKSSKNKKIEGAGTYKTDGQGVADGLGVDANKPKVAKKLDPNSAAARRRRAADAAAQVNNTTEDADNIGDFSSFHSRFEEGGAGEVDQDQAFSTADNPFAFDTKSEGGGADSGDNMFASFDSSADGEGFGGGWGGGDSKDGGGFDAFASFSPDTDGAQMTDGQQQQQQQDNGGDDGEDGEDGERRRRSRSNSQRRPRRKVGRTKSGDVVPGGGGDEEDVNDAMQNMDIGGDGDDADGGEGGEGTSKSSSSGGRQRRSTRSSRSAPRRTTSSGHRSRDRSKGDERRKEKPRDP